MDQSEVKRIVDQHAEEMAGRLRIGHWKITAVYGPCSNPEWSAECRLDASRDMATFTFDPERLKSEAEVLDLLQHEMLHIVLAPFDLFEMTARSLVGDDEIARNVLRLAGMHAVEQSVLNLERMIRELTRVTSFAHGPKGDPKLSAALAWQPACLLVPTP
jgi:hypothetical protein